ncbi:hypothetical protein Kisp02_28360 [Kineosporia sp. NBRC 101731]|nr:hypothetical protein Kisp02_28360 [Kineosporia sp. NBRC 101731]
MLARYLGAPLLLLLSSCGSGSDGGLTWALALRNQDCANPVGAGGPGEPISRVRTVACSRAHQLEVYATLSYSPGDRPGGTDPRAQYPGHEALKKYAREQCAGRYRAYLGAAPRTPDQYLTYLYPSVASWTAYGDTTLRTGPLERIVGKAPPPRRTIICVVQSTGAAFDHSVRTGGKNPA